MKKRTIIIVCAVITAVICSVFFVLMTESGLQWTFRRLSSAVPGLSARSLNGRLTGPLEIEGLVYSEPGMSLYLNSLHLDWKPLKLFSLNFHVTRLDAEGLKIATSVNEETAKTESGPGDISLPVTIEIESARIQNISVSGEDPEAPFIIHDVVLSASLNSESAAVHFLNVTSPVFVLSAKGDISLGKNFPLDILTDWEIYPEGTASIKGKGRLSGSLKELKIVQETSSPFRGLLDGTVVNVMNEIEWQALLTLFEFKTRHVNPEWPDVEITAQLQGKGTPSIAGIKGTLTARDRLYFGELSGSVDVMYNNGRISVNNIMVSVPEKNTDLEVHGEYDPSNTVSPVKLNAKWTSLVWPLTGNEGLLSSKEGRIILNGSPEKYLFQIHAFLDPRHMFQSEWTIKGKGTDSGVSFDTFTAKLLNGEVHGRGTMNWKPAPDWTIAFRGSHLNPAIIAPDWEGDVSMDMSAFGSTANDMQKVQLNVRTIEGQLRGHPLRGVIQADISGDTYTLRQFDLHSGSARLTAAGTLGGTSDIIWDINAPDLGNMYPGGKGSIHGKGTIKGTRSAPEINAVLEGKEIAVAAFKSDTIGINAAVNLQEDSESTLDIQASKIVINTESIDTLSLTGSGKRADHRIGLHIISEKRDLLLNITGAYSNSTWNGQLGQADLSFPDFGSWSLQGPVHLYVSADTAESARLCLTGAGSTVCMQGEWKKDAESRGMFSLSRFPLPLFKTFLAPGTELEGLLDGEAHISLEKDGLLKGTIHFNAEKASVSVHVDKGKKIGLTFTEAEIESRFDETGFRSELNSTLSDGGSVNGQLMLPPLTLDMNPESLEISRGNLKAEILDLGFIPVFLPGIAESAGVLRADMNVSGRLYSPVFSGQISIDKGSAYVDRLGLRLEEIRMKADSDGSGTVIINGHIKSGEGPVRLSGNINLKQEQNLSADFKIIGDNFEAIKTPELWMLVSPEIDLSMRDRIIDVRGIITVPEATIKPRDISGSVQSSKDVIITGERSTEKAGTPWKTRGEVKIILGEKVRFKGFGLTGNITGNITVVEEPGKPTRGTGELRIVNGRYKAYGQDLDIEKGRLLFVGGPIENPGFDIRAVRKTGDVTAGVMVSGSLSEPLMTLFSVPSMDQSDALSYLLLGRPLRQASSSQGQQLVNAASSAGLSGGNFLAKKIGARFGIEDIEIKKGETYKDSSLYIGKYLSPRLYVGYGIGLFQPVNIITARYQLSRKWLVQGEHGLESGGDLLFQIER